MLDSGEPAAKENANDIVKDERSPDEADDRELPSWMLGAAAREDENEDAPLSRDEETDARASPARNDANQGVETSNLVATDRPIREACMYGERCYRRNPAHRTEYSHPGDDDYKPELPGEDVQPEEDSRPECQYGTACYRRNPKHKQEFKHTGPPLDRDQAPMATRKPPAKRRRKANEDEYEPPGENGYDLSDPFIDDSEPDEEEESEEKEDEDYVPENNKDDDDGDGDDEQLNNEEEWQEAADDPPEVLQLLKEARDFLRNKAMQK